MDPRETVTTLWRLFDERRFEETRPLFTEDFVADWPQTRERILGAENFIQLNRAYPGAWSCHLRDIVGAGERLATEVEITDGATVVHAASFYTFQDGRIASVREFFADPGEPPYDRSRWAERY